MQDGPLVNRLDRIRDVMLMHGRELIEAMLLLIIGLIVIQYVMKRLRHWADKLPKARVPVSIALGVLHVLLLVMVVSTALVEAGADSRAVFRFLLFLTLAVVGVIVVFRPYIPTLPFKVGNTVKFGNLLGKVEATTFINTRIRSFDGLTVFVPNSKILNDYVINYHFTPTRRFKVDVQVRYDQDILRAKQVIESVLIGDPRVKTAPRPVVWVIGYRDGRVHLGGRGWVDNAKYWGTRCELIEKTVLRLRQENILLAYPQQDVHVYQQDQPYQWGGLPEELSESSEYEEPGQVSGGLPDPEAVEETG